MIGRGDPPVIRRHDSGDTVSEAQYSACGQYRYALTRIWQPDAPRLLWVMLNPSTASELRNDPTVARCENRARAGGFGGFRVVNLFAFRATAPADLRRAADPTGPDNDAAIATAATWAYVILCAWGMHGDWQGRGAAVAARLRRAGHALHHLGLTQAGAPRHPLYLPRATPMQPWTGADPATQG
ncbi:DUF1643 domain-containing protein [Szabonella alba]|uniref:DUF1643 domain-containing protein n=1 Tax=Szabonella alba TaxID=2804194 RepID=A0A8K0XZM3_9RHOB|nr:DUF1643 domain-containing protein [Szabonella alba]MBL4916951.1 DUF1643 domain-containing protein [Szabonella alba]